MSDKMGLSIPDYFPREELDKLEMSFSGQVEPITKTFEGVEVEYSSSSRNGLYLTFRNLKNGHSIILSPDYEDANFVIHLIIKGNSTL